MPRIDENGNVEFHPVELPPEYRPAKMRYDNSFIREVQPMKQSRRNCKTCGTPFTLLGEYDPGNPAHDLCDDCLLALPPNPDQRYPEKTAQIAGILEDPEMQDIRVVRYEREEEMATEMGKP